MKSKIQAIKLVFFICIFLLITFPLFAQDCSVGSSQYRPIGSCGTEEKKCCRSGSGTAWSQWGEDCKGTPCPASCDNGLFRNPDVNFQEEGSCCVDACRHPDKKNTCECINFAMGRGMCTCFPQGEGLYRKLLMQSSCEGETGPELRECVEYYMQRISRDACYNCPGFLEGDENRDMCCRAMGGEMNWYEDKCYSSSLEWVRTDSVCSTMLCYSGHCSVMMTPVQSQGDQRWPKCTFSTSGSSNPRCSQSQFGNKCNDCVTNRRNLPQADHDKWCGKGKTMYSSCVREWTCQEGEPTAIF